MPSTSEQQMLERVLPAHARDLKELRKGLKKVSATIHGRKMEFIVANWIPIFGNHFAYRVTQRMPDESKRFRYLASARTWEHTMKHATRWIQTPSGETKGKSVTVNLNRRARIRDVRTMKLIPFDQVLMSPTFNQLGVDVTKLAASLPDVLVAGMIEVHGTAEASKYYQMWLQEKGRADDLDRVYKALERNIEKRAHTLAEGMYRDLMMGLEAAINFAKANTLKGNWVILLLLFLGGLVMGILVDRAILAYVGAG